MHAIEMGMTTRQETTMPTITVTKHMMDSGLVIMVQIEGDINDEMRSDLERLGYTDYREDGTCYRKGCRTPAELTAARDPLKKYFA
jgi:hypothetical protein